MTFMTEHTYFEECLRPYNMGSKTTCD